MKKLSVMNVITTLSLIFIGNVVNASVNEYLSNNLKHELIEESELTELGLNYINLNMELTNYYLDFVNDLDFGVPNSNSQLYVDYPDKSNPQVVQLSWPRSYWSRTNDSWSTVNIGGPYSANGTTPPKEYYKAEKDYLVVKSSPQGNVVIGRARFTSQVHPVDNSIQNLVTPDVIAFYDYLSDEERSQYITYHVVPLRPNIYIQIDCETEMVEREYSSLSLVGIVSVTYGTEIVEVCKSPPIVDMTQDAIENAEAIYASSLVTPGFIGAMIAINALLI